MVQVLGINGALRPGSTADRALRHVLGLLADGGAACATFDISGLPLLDGRPEAEYPASVSEWRGACRGADGLVVATPSYHGAMPGGLKNALDFIDTAEVGGKPFLVVAVAGGDAEPAAADVTRVLRHVGGVAGAPDVVVSRAAEAWGKGELPASPEAAEAVRRAAAAFLALCRLRAEGRLPGP